MIYKNQIIVFIVSFLIAGFFLLSTPENTTAGLPACCDLRLETDPRGPVCVASAQACTADAPNAVCSLCTVTGPCNCPASGACCGATDAGETRIDCIVISPELCESAGGAYQGDDVTCEEAECPPTPIPTLNQYGMIIMAGVLGLFAVIGLFVMKRSGVVRPSS